MAFWALLGDPNNSTPRVQQEPAALQDFSPTYVRFGSKAARTINAGFAAHVCFAPKADKQQIVSAGPLSADFVAKVVDGPEEQ